MSMAIDIVEELCKMRRINLTAARKSEIAGRYINRFFLLEINAERKLKKRGVDLLRVHCEPDSQQIIADLSDIGLIVDYFNNVYNIRW